MGHFFKLTAVLLLFSPILFGQSPGKTRTYYIAADEVDWDYVPGGVNKMMGMKFEGYSKVFVERGPHRIGTVCRKAIYREYTDETFSQLKPRPAEWTTAGILGPILRAEVDRRQGRLLRPGFRIRRRQCQVCDQRLHLWNWTDDDDEKGERVRWYLVALREQFSVHTPHWHGNVVLHNGKRTDVVSLMQAQMETVDMVPDNPGIWMFHCHIDDHMDAGMVTLYKVEP